MTSHVQFRTNRTISGTMEYRVDGKRVGGPWECYGKSDDYMARVKGNPSRNPLIRFGDTPTGIYTPKVLAKQADTHKYGPHPPIELKPKSGDCLKAEHDGGRSGIWDHGGALNASGKLRPTYGCIRSHDEDMAEKHRLIAEFGPLTEYHVTEE